MTATPQKRTALEIQAELAATLRDAPPPRQAADRTRAQISIVVPVFNEETTVERFLAATKPVLDGMNTPYEIIFVNDGSTDGTLERLARLRAQDNRIKIVDLSRNFGKEIALSAGLDYSSGDAVIPIDVDLQDPPELIPEMIARWHDGYEVVLGVRSDRSIDTRVKRLSSELFYRVFNRVAESPIPKQAGDFRLLDKKVVQVLRLFPERNRFNKGIFSWAGFRHTAVRFERPARSHGATKWNYWRLMGLALDAIFSFSVIPLRVWSVIGVLCSLVAFLYGAFLILSKAMFGNAVPGYPSLMVVVLFMGGIQLLCLGVLGEYLGRIYRETKGRPLYVVHRAFGLTPPPELARDRQPLIIED